jgi:hypothetical protein
MALTAAPATFAVTIHDEALDGDLSGSGAAPTALAFAPGVNSVSGSTVAGDLDYFSFGIPAGYLLGQIVLAEFVTTDDRSFIAIQSGSAFTEPPSGTDPANLLGWTHFGTALDVPGPGTNILDEMGAAVPAIGFPGPLPAGSYTVWLQETGGIPVGYRLDFVVIPEPASGALLGLALAGLWFARRYR